MRYATCRLLAPLSLCLCLAACDSGESPATVIEGVASDGYLVGAKVCLDINADAVCGNGEPATLTTRGGRYRLATPGILRADAQAYGLVVEVDASVIDEDTGVPVGNEFVMTAPVGQHALVNPLTTLLVEQMRRHAQSQDTALAVLAARLGISTPGLLLQDYAVAGATPEQRTLHNIARVLARGLAADHARLRTARGGDIPVAGRRGALNMASGNLLAQLGILALAVSPDMSSEQLLAIPVAPLAIDAMLIERQLVVDANMAKDMDLAAHLDDGLCRGVLASLAPVGDVPRSGDPQACIRRDGNDLLLVSERYLGEGYPEESERFLGLMGGDWADFDLARRPVTVDGNVARVAQHGGEDTFEVQVMDLSGRQINDFGSLIGGTQLHDDGALFPPGSRAYKVKHRVARAERLAISARDFNFYSLAYRLNLYRLPVASLDEMLRVYAEDGTGGWARETWQLYEGHGRYPSVLRESFVRFAQDGVLLRQFHYAWYVDAVDEPGAENETYPATAGTWVRTTLAGLDVVMTYDGAGAESAIWVMHEGAAYPAFRLPPKTEYAEFFLLSPAARDALQ